MSAPSHHWGVDRGSTVRADDVTGEQVATVYHVAVGRDDVVDRPERRLVERGEHSVCRFDPQRPPEAIGLMADRGDRRRGRAGVALIGDDEMERAFELDVAAMTPPVGDEALVRREHDLDHALALEVEPMVVGRDHRTGPLRDDRCIVEPERSANAVDHTEGTLDAPTDLAETTGGAVENALVPVSDQRSEVGEYRL